MKEKQLKILINLATLKKGGGQNVGINLIYSIINSNRNLAYFHFVVARNSDIHSILLHNKISNITILSANPILRMIEELVKGRFIVRVNRINIIYSVFGIGLYPNYVKQVSGSADSNIFYPDVNFWEHSKGFNKIGKFIVDQFRIYALKKATAVVFENESMRQRAIELYNLKNTKFIKPSFFLSQNNVELLDLKKSKSSTLGLFFCGWQKNKNYHLIPDIAKELKTRNVDFHLF